jgi:hypothetical protein
MRFRLPNAAKKINGLLSDSHQERNRKSMTAIRGIKKRRNGGERGIRTHDTR